MAQRFGQSCHVNSPVRSVVCFLQHKRVREQRVPRRRSPANGDRSSNAEAERLPGDAESNGRNRDGTVLPAACRSQSHPGLFGHGQRIARITVGNRGGNTAYSFGLPAFLRPRTAPAPFMPTPCKRERSSSFERWAPAVLFWPVPGRSASTFSISRVGVRVCR